MASQVTINHAALARLLKSAEVEAALLERAHKVQAAAEAAGVMVQRGDAREPMPYTTKSDPAHDRARVFVVADHPAGLAAEAKYRALGRAVDSA